MRTIRPLLAGTITLAMLGTLPLSGSAQDTAADAVDAAWPAGGAASVRAPMPSLGCGRSDVEAGLSNGEPLVIDGEEREWTMFVPQAYDGMDPVPLWVQLHGKNGSYLSSAFLVASTAEKHSFVVVAPQGNYGNPSWLWRKADHDVDLTRANPDLAFVEALVAHLGKILCLDLARVYAVGENQGGYAVTGLACVLENHLAAVATVSGVYDLGERCVLDRPVPLLSVHGRNDAHALFDGGSGPHIAGLALSGDGERMVYGDHPIVKTYQSASIPTRMEGIAMRNGCEPSPTVEVIGDEQERWTWDCPAGAEVELVTHEGGYEWPIGEPLAIDERIWEFFEQHPMPE